MRHLDGVRVALKSNGQDLTEYSNQYCRKTSYLDRSIGSRSITLPGGSQFEVLLELGREFQLHGARGVSVVIAFHPDHHAQQGTEYAQVWWIPLKPATFGSQYTFKHTMVWNHGAQNAELVAFKLPAPAQRPQSATDKWLKDPVYQANSGCLSVHVQRGQVDLPRAARERREDFTSPRSNVEPPRNALRNTFEQPYPIRLEWFFSKAGKHGEPYVFEFRNLGPNEVDYTTAGELNFKDTELSDFYATEKNNLSEEDIGCEESESEEEEEEEEIIDHRRTQTNDDGSPVKRMGKLKTRAKAHKQAEISSSSDEDEESEESEDESDGEGPGTTIRALQSQLFAMQDELRRMTTPDEPQGSRKISQYAKKAIPPDSQHNGTKSKQITRQPLNTLSRFPIPPSAAIKRKLSDCDDEDQDDEEFLPQVKTEQFAVTKPAPLTPTQESPGSSRNITSGGSGNKHGGSSSKRARIECDLELLKIRKKELELLNELDELEKE